MKFSTTFVLALVATLFLSCSNDNINSVPQSANPAATTTTPDLSNTPVAAGSVQHYICPNNCAGSGGGTAGNCPVCGSEYTHNTAFHNNDNADTPPPPTPSTPDLNSTPIAAGGVQHYICSNNCAGSGGASAGNCPVCGNPYTHNTAFHNQQNSTTNSTVTPTSDQNTLSPLFQNTPQQPQVNVPQITSPSNASGVYHYICSNGCAGGSGMAGNCTSCGSALVHNQAYHQ